VRKEGEGGKAHDWLDDPGNLVNEGDGSGDMVENGDLSNLLYRERSPKEKGRPTINTSSKIWSARVWQREGRKDERER